MGWSELSAQFCAASETVWYIAAERERTKIGSLPEHTPEEQKTATLSTVIPHKPPMLQFTRWLIKFHVDNFISLAQNTPRALLKDIARAILISIHDFFCSSLHNRSQGWGISSHQKSPWRQRHTVQKTGYIGIDLQQPDILHLPPPTQGEKDKKGD